jgi:3-phosphoshikimate 1-carboxyvinyltransferase
MRVEIRPGIAQGKVKAPPSKSMAHRYLIAAALCKGKSEISGIEYSQDILATLDCLRALGVNIECKEDIVTVFGGELSLQGDLLCRESGSTLRFLLPLCLLFEKKAVLKGSDRLMERPMTVYQRFCEEQGFDFEQSQGEITVCGKLQCGEYVVDGSVSSQFITGLIFALLCCAGESRLVLAGKLESRSYIDLTLSALQKFGFIVDWTGENSIRLCGGSGTPQSLTVEGDYSNAAFLEAFNLFGGGVEVCGLDPHSLQGDRIYRDYFEKIRCGNPILSLADCPDLGPILMAVAALCHGAEFTDTARLKIKESDRGSAMAEELKKCGASVTVLENRIIVRGDISRPQMPFKGHNDHRIVMALALICSRFGGAIEGAEAVNKSFPSFFKAIEQLGIEVDFFETE